MNFYLKSGLTVLIQIGLLLVIGRLLFGDNYIKIEGIELWKILIFLPLLKFVFGISLR